jgi:mannan endo-1,4-beta-mannosidase
MITINNRLDALKKANLQLSLETAPLNAGVLMNPKPFLDIIYNRSLSVCAWVWKMMRMHRRPINKGRITK